MSVESCPKCESTNLIRQTGTDEPSTKYGRLICSDCGSFVKWLRDPDVSISHINRKQAIDSMLNSNLNSNLNQWERSFLRNIYEVRVLSPKQLSTYQRICQKITPSLGSGRGGRAMTF